MMSAIKSGAMVVPVVVPTPFDVGDVNMYLYKDREHLALIDAGIDTDDGWERLLRALSEHGWGLHQLSSVWLTHHHQDHIGLVNRIAAKRDIPVYAHAKSLSRLKRDEAFLAMRVAFFDRLYQGMGCGAAGKRHVRRMEESKRANDRLALRTEVLPVAEGDVLGPCRIVEVPGHAPDHIAFWDEERAWLFGGDHLLAHISSNAFVEPDERGGRLRTLVHFGNSLRLCEGMGAELVWPGHGTPIKDPDALIRRRVNRIEEKAEKIRSFIESGVVTGYELAKAMYPSKYESVFGPVMSEIIGLLDVLETSGKVYAQERNGVLQYVSAEDE